MSIDKYQLVLLRLGISVIALLLDDLVDRVDCLVAGRASLPIPLALMASESIAHEVEETIRGRGIIVKC